MNLVHLSARLSLFMAVMLVSAPGSGWGQDLGVQVGVALVGDRLPPLHISDERTYGTTSLVSHTLGAYAFTGNAASTPYFGNISPGSRYCEGSSCAFVAPVLLPAGARVTTVQLDACDDSNSGSVDVALFRIATPELGLTYLALGTTGTSDALGCISGHAPLFAPETIDNVRNTYIIQVSTTTSDSTTRFAAVRVFYDLQVSPPPVTPTFNDVPTGHPFYPFIQALVAAGITTGCSTTPPLFCPDGPVTRKQMAAFLAKALGLHWVP